MLTQVHLFNLFIRWRIAILPSLRQTLFFKYCKNSLNKLNWNHEIKLIKQTKLICKYKLIFSSIKDTLGIITSRERQLVTLRLPRIVVDVRNVLSIQETWQASKNCMRFRRTFLMILRTVYRKHATQLYGNLEKRT